MADNIHGRHSESGTTRIATARPLLLPCDVLRLREEVPFPRHLKSETGRATTTNMKQRFRVTDVSTPFIVVDFLNHYGLLVDPRNRHHSDKTSNVATTRYADTTEAVSSKTIDASPTSRRIVGRDSPTRSVETKYDTVRYFISKTTPGCMYVCTARKLQAG